MNSDSFIHAQIRNLSRLESFLIFYENQGRDILNAITKRIQSLPEFSDDWTLIQRFTNHYNNDLTRFWTFDLDGKRSKTLIDRADFFAEEIKDAIAIRSSAINQRLLASHKNMEVKPAPVILDAIKPLQSFIDATSFYKLSESLLMDVSTDVDSRHMFEYKSASIFGRHGLRDPVINNALEHMRKMFFMEMLATKSLDLNNLRDRSFNEYYQNVSPYITDYLADTLIDFDTMTSVFADKTNPSFFAAKEHGWGTLSTVVSEKQKFELIDYFNRSPSDIFLVDKNGIQTVQKREMNDTYESCAQAIRAEHAPSGFEM